MISVRYVAPISQLVAPSSHECHLDPYTMLSPWRGSMPYVVEVEHDSVKACLFEGDHLVVDEKRIPQAGDMAIYGTKGNLYACRVYENGGFLCPIDYEKLNHEHQVVFGGVVTRLIRYYL